MSILKSNRREFLKDALIGCGGIAALGAFSPLIRYAHAVEGAGEAGVLKDRYYIFCYFGGGWDILLSLDPRDPTVFTNDGATVSKTKIMPGYELLTPFVETPYVDIGHGYVGPFMGDLAAKHADKMAIVRGINMETLSHGSGRKRFLTGKPASGVQARGSSASTWFVSQLGQENVIPNLDSGVGTYNVDQPTYASGIKASNVSDLLRALRPSDPSLPTAVNEQIDMLLAQAANCSRGLLSPSHQSAEASRLKAAQMVNSHLDMNFDFLAKNDKMAALRDHYNIANNNGGLSSIEARAAMAAKAVMQGISRCVSVSLAGGLDTHGNDWASAQGPRQQRGFNAVARLIEDLDGKEYGNTGKSWLDHTNIVCFSEFSRTSRLNANTGRDHWLGNASAVIGADIKGGQIIGASSDVGMQPMAVNLATGQVDSGGVVLNPEHIMQTLMNAAGIVGDPADLRCDPITALMK